MAATNANAEHYRIEIKRVRRALAQPLQTGGGHCIAVRESVLLKVTAQTDASRTGYGEAATLPWFGTESADEAADALSALGSVLHLETAKHALQRGDKQAHWQDMLEQCLPDKTARRLSALPCARWALESALRQAHALPQRGTPQNASPAALQSTPIAQQKAPVAARAIPVAALLPAGTPAVPEGLIAAGFRVFKTKIGVRSFAEEATGITALLRSLQEHTTAANGAYTPPREASHSGLPRRSAKAAHSKETAPFAPFKVRLDANGSLDNERLNAWLQCLAPFAQWIDFIEQPLPIGQEAQTAAAFTGSPLTFAFDESLTSLPQLRQISTHFPQAVLVVKPSLLGSAEGFLQWRHSCSNNRHAGSDSHSTEDTSESHSRANTGRHAHTQLDSTCSAQIREPRIVYSSALETGIGLHHALSLAATDPCQLEPVGFGTGILFAQDGLGAPPELAATITFFTTTDAPSTLPAHSATNTVPHARDTGHDSGSASHHTEDATVMQCLRAQMEAVWKRA